MHFPMDCLGLKAVSSTHHRVATGGGPRKNELMIVDSEMPESIKPNDIRVISLAELKPGLMKTCPGQAVASRCPGCGGPCLSRDSCRRQHRLTRAHLMKDASCFQVHSRASSQRRGPAAVRVAGSSAWHRSHPHWGPTQQSKSRHPLYAPFGDSPRIWASETRGETGASSGFHQR
jgi:hypothetical protein